MVSFFYSACHLFVVLFLISRDALDILHVVDNIIAKSSIPHLLCNAEPTQSQAIRLILYFV